MNYKRARISNDRKVRMMLSILLIILALIYIVGKSINININKKNNYYTVTMLGGSNVKENGDLNSMGYLIQTKNNKLIVVDGGREIDANLVYEKIKSIGCEKVDYWFLTHAHNDHIGALVTILENEEYDLTIENLCFNFNSKDWYEKYDTERDETAVKLLDYVEKIENGEQDKKIYNLEKCKAGDLIEIDNLCCKILRVANPEIIESKYVGNEASMVFKFFMKNKDGKKSDKDMLFLGDAYIETGNELLKNCNNDLKSYAVQMAHHGQNGVSKEVYDAIDPTLCFFNAPKWLYENDNGGGYNSGTWQSVEVRGWIENPTRKTKSVLFQAYNGDTVVRINEKGYQVFI